MDGYRNRNNTNFTFTKTNENKIEASETFLHIHEKNNDDNLIDGKYIQATIGNNCCETKKLESVGIFRASFFTYISIISLASTILICYTMAAYNGHVVAFLPMISSCGVSAPEKYIFTIGIIFASIFIFINACLFYYFLNSGSLGKRKDEDRIALFLAFISSLGLAFVGAVNEKEDNIVHCTAALIFFTAHTIYMIFSTVRIYSYSNVSRPISRISIVVKTILIILAIIIMSLSGVFFILDYINEYFHLWLAITEWIGSFIIIFYNLSYVFEFGHVEYLGSLLLS